MDMKVPQLLYEKHIGDPIELQVLSNSMLLNIITIAWDKWCWDGDKIAHNIYFECFNILEQRREDYNTYEVYIDLVDGEAGSLYPIGTARRPVNNIDDAIKIMKQCNVYKADRISLIVKPEIPITSNLN